MKVLIRKFCKKLLPSSNPVVFNTVSGLTHSPSMNNTVTNKIKHAHQLLALGPQIAFKQKWHYFLSWSTITIKLNIYLYKYKDDYICKSLLQALCLVTINISGRKQRTKIGSVFSEWWKIICGIPQGSILGPLLFNIFVNDLFFFALKCDICNFADDNTMYSCNKLLSKILANLQFDLKNVLMWFTVNSLSPNQVNFSIWF